MNQPAKQVGRILLVALVCAQCVPWLRAQSKGDEEAVHNIPQAFAAAWARHDGHQMAKLMAEDVDFVTVGADWLHGRTDFEVYHSRLLTGRFKDAVLTVNDVKVRFLRPDLAVLHWSWTVEGDRNEDMSPRKPRTGLMTMIVEKQGPKNFLAEATRKDKDWLVEVAQNTDWMPGPVPELDGINPPIVLSDAEVKPGQKPVEAQPLHPAEVSPDITPVAVPATPAASQPPKPAETSSDITPVAVTQPAPTEGKPVENPPVKPLLDKPQQ
jgi:uncharacterized protein (TIGR02246 family)